MPSRGKLNLKTCPPLLGGGDITSHSVGLRTVRESEEEEEEGNRMSCTKERANFCFSPTTIWEGFEVGGCAMCVCVCGTMCKSAQGGLTLCVHRQSACLVTHTVLTGLCLYVHKHCGPLLHGKFRCTNPIKTERDAVQRGLCRRAAGATVPYIYTYTYTYMYTHTSRSALASWDAKVELRMPVSSGL